jgi:hypothetical protein
MRWVCLMGLLMAGCDDSFAPVPPDPSVSDGGGCPEGLSAASDASFITTQFTVNGAGSVTDFVQLGVYDGVPSACMSEDGRSLQLIFEVAGVGFGQVAMTHSGPGAYEPNDTAASFRLDLFGADPPAVYGAGDWQSGSWNVDEDQGAVI